MKMKHSLIFGLICATLGLSSCDSLSWSQIQTQALDIVSIESSTMVLVGATLDKHPEYLDTFKNISGALKLLALQDSIKLSTVKTLLYSKIDQEVTLGRQELKNLTDKLLDKISPDGTIDLAEHRAELQEVITGIDAAVKYYEEKHEVTATK